MMDTAHRTSRTHRTESRFIVASRAARNAAALDAKVAEDNIEKENTVTESTAPDEISAEPTTEEKAERVKRTPAERAQLRLYTARKRAAKAQARLDKLNAGIASAEKELNRANREVEFRLTDEDLPEQPETLPETVVGVEDDDTGADEYDPES